MAAILLTNLVFLVALVLLPGLVSAQGSTLRTQELSSVFTETWEPSLTIQVKSILQCSVEIVGNLNYTGFHFNATSGSCSLGNLIVYKEVPGGPMLTYALADSLQRIYTRLVVVEIFQFTWAPDPSRASDTVYTDCLNDTDQQPPSYPFSNYMPVSAVLVNQLVICGGSDYPGGGTPVATCFRLEMGSSTWVQLGPMPKAVKGGASAAVDQGWWVAGGLTTGAGSNNLQTVIFNSSQNSWSYGTDIISPRYSHCMARINGTAVFLAGGQNATPSYAWLGDAWTYSFETAAWTALPDLIVGVSGPGLACGYYQQQQTGRGKIVVVTGWGQTAISLDLTTLVWCQLADLPTTVGNVAFVPNYYNGLALFSTFGNLLLFNTIDETFDLLPWQSITVNEYPNAVAAITSSFEDYCDCL